MIVLDTSIVIAFMNAADADHAVVRDWLRAAAEPLVTTPLTLAEVDHLVSRHGGSVAARAFRQDLERGAYQVEWWPAAVPDTLAVAGRYAAIGLGLTDASLVALAGHLPTARVATLDERHFRSVEPLTGEGAFTVLPADASVR